MGSDPEISLSNPAGENSGSAPLPRRHFQATVRLSILGLGGVTLAGLDGKRADRLVADAVGRGVNYFDVAPSYGDGEAEEKLGAALSPFRADVFLAGKTLARSGTGVRRDLEQSLRRLRTGNLDLYQLHAVSRAEEADRVFAPGGAMEALVRAREEGLVRFLGFSSHSVPVALTLLERFRFDSILFPINFICYDRGNFGPQVLARARALGVACIALKALAHGRRARSEAVVYPNLWYRPIEDPHLALQALRFTLSEDVTSVLPPGDERLYRMALDLAHRFTPMTSEERRQLLDSAAAMKPLMWAPKK